MCMSHHLQALRVLILRKRSHLNNGLLQQLVQHQASWALQELDVSLPVGCGMPAQICIG
jgi:hypothetical protein